MILLCKSRTEKTALEELLLQYPEILDIAGLNDEQKYVLRNLRQHSKEKYRPIMITLLSRSRFKIFDMNTIYHLILIKEGREYCFYALTVNHEKPWKYIPFNLLNDEAKKNAIKHMEEVSFTIMQSNRGVAFSVDSYEYYMRYIDLLASYGVIIQYEILWDTSHIEEHKLVVTSLRVEKERTLVIESMRKDKYFSETLKDFKLPASPSSIISILKKAAVQGFKIFVKEYKEEYNYERELTELHSLYDEQGNPLTDQILLEPVG